MAYICNCKPVRYFPQVPDGAILVCCCELGHLIVRVLSCRIPKHVYLGHVQEVVADDPADLPYLLDKYDCLVYTFSDCAIVRVVSVP